MVWRLSGIWNSSCQKPAMTMQTPARQTRFTGHMTSWGLFWMKRLQMWAQTGPSRTGRTSTRATLLLKLTACERLSLSSIS